MNQLSIVIPTYNRSSLLKRAVNSVLNEPGNFEVIIVNDNSTDDTNDVVNGFDDARIKYINKPENGGVNAARNTAFEKATGEWLFCLDDDDELLPGSLAVITKRLQEMPENFNVAYFNSKIIRDDREIIGVFEFESGQEFYDPGYIETMAKKGLRGDCKPAFRKTLFKNTRYRFPETVNGFESYIMNLIARDKKGIRYWRDVITLIHQESFLTDRLSNNAPKKGPFPMFVLHLKQIREHWRFYLLHPDFFIKKIIEAFKLFVRSVLKIVAF